MRRVVDSSVAFKWAVIEALTDAIALPSPDRRRYTSHRPRPALEGSHGDDQAAVAAPHRVREGRRRLLAQPAAGAFHGSDAAIHPARDHAGKSGAGQGPPPRRTGL